MESSLRLSIAVFCMGPRLGFARFGVDHVHHLLDFHDFT
jgi:hypothetical protein